MLTMAKIVFVFFILVHIYLKILRRKKNRQEMVIMTFAWSTDRQIWKITPLKAKPRQANHVTSSNTRSFKFRFKNLSFQLSNFSWSFLYLAYTNTQYSAVSM